MDFTLSLNQRKIMDQLGFADWDTAVSTFAGLSKEDVLDLLDETVIGVNSTTLANLIVKEMPHYVTTKQAARNVDLTDVAIRKRCQNGKIPGAKIMRGSWYIPAEAARNITRKRAHKTNM
ncbi:MAG: hypothetical protein RBT34_00580 [Anaerolineaceae bacterium]|nr:hypothetical protein [Anaerolineaceae bacterium]